MLLPILLAVAVLTFWMMPATARPHLMMALNVAFVVAVMPATESVVLLAAFLAVCFALLHQRWVPLAVSVAVVVTIYVLLKSPRSLSEIGRAHV